jgi:hypothetical protein
MASQRTDSDRRTLRWASLLVCIVTALALEGSARPAPGPQLSLSAAKYFATGADPQSFALADVNGDGRPDVVTTNNDGKSVSVLRNRGNGTFASKRDYRVGVDPSPLAVAELNGDGHPDLVARGSEAHSLSVLLNRGDGTFGQRELTDAGPGCCDQLRTADLNGDGRVDVVTRTDGIATVLPNAGDGTFPTKHEYTVASGFPGALVVADLSGDARPDIATTHESNTVSVLLNDGDGTFGRENLFKARGRSLVAADVNRDGSRDLVTTTTDVIDAIGSVSVLINRGHGSFRRARTYRPGRDVAASAIADLNGDGAPELMVISDIGMSVFKNSGDGRFGHKRNYPPVGWYLDFVVADVNGGGAPDLVFQSWDFGRVAVLLNRGNGTFSQQLLEYHTSWGPVALAVADLNGDRSSDVLTLSDGLGGNRVSVLLNTPGKCDVQDVFRKTLEAARSRLARGGCRLGRVAWGHSRLPVGLVMGQRPKFGAVLRGGSTVDLILSRGQKRS